MNDDKSFPALLTDKQKRIARVVLTAYLLATGSFTIYQGAYSVALFYAILLVIDFYLYMHLGDWVKSKKK